MTPKMLQLLKQEEGFRAFPYRDTRGFLTIGYGTNLDAGITEEQASALLEIQIRYLSGRLSYFEWYVSLDPVRRSVIENMAYNMGVDGVLGFREMIASIEARDWRGAAAQMLNSIWAQQVGERAVVLARIMETGDDNSA